MKKHIIGLVLFSFIVSAAAIVYRNGFIADKLLSTKHYSIKTASVDGNRKIGTELRVKQAVYNLKSRLLDWEISAPRVDSPVALHFFVKDRNGVNYVASGQGVTSCLIEARLNFTTYYSGLDNLKSYENLYVIAEFNTYSNVYNDGYEPKFDASKATPVLLYIDNRPPPITD